MRCDIEIHWQVCMTCNFRCEYCFHGRNQENAFAGMQDIEMVVEAFNGLGLTCLINISGGEPFSHKKFLELCRRLTERHMISINTNLSYKNVYRFADEIDPGKVRFLNCSVNIADRDRMGLVDDYIDKFNYLREKGFAAYATYVMYPPFFKRFEEDYAYFKSRGVVIRPKIFRGDFDPWFVPNSWKIRQFKKFLNGGSYPNAYLRREKRKLLSWIDRSEKEAGNPYADDNGEWMGRTVNVGLDRLLMNGLPSFKGRRCLAGKAFVRMNPYGDVFRCHSSKDPMGNLFDGSLKLLDQPQPCRWDNCLCPYLGYTYVIDNPEFRGIGEYEKKV